MRAIRVAYVELLWPYYEQCAKKIEEMDQDQTLYIETLRQPLAVLKENGELTDIWSGNALAEIFRALLFGLGYLN